MRELRLGQTGDPNPAEFCEIGATAAAWDLMRHRCSSEFFAKVYPQRTSRLTRLRSGTSGAAAHLPMKYDPVTDKYVACRREDAFAEIGRELKQVLVGVTETRHSHLSVEAHTPWFRSRLRESRTVSREANASSTSQRSDPD